MYHSLILMCYTCPIKYNLLQMTTSFISFCFLNVDGHNQGVKEGGISAYGIFCNMKICHPRLIPLLQDFS